MSAMLSIRCGHCLVDTRRVPAIDTLAVEATATEDPMTSDLPDSNSVPPSMIPAPPHSLVEDVLGVLSGTFLAALGLYLLRVSEAVTGGTAGLALLLNYLGDVPFGVAFVAINLPFFALAIWRKGWNFTLRSITAVVLLAAFAEFHPYAMPDITPNPVYAVITGNFLIGVGMLILFRHGASLGGFNVLALILQERLGIRAGNVQMALDVVVVLSALAVVPLGNVLISAAGAVVLNLVLTLNHRPGRYLGS